jgi:hypothetical protein
MSEKRAGQKLAENEKSLNEAMDKVLKQLHPQAPLIGNLTRALNYVNIYINKADIPEELEERVNLFRIDFYKLIKELHEKLGTPEFLMESIKKVIEDSNKNKLEATDEKI